MKALPGGDLYLELQEQKKRLVTESSRLSDIGSTVDSALRNRVQMARHWLKEVSAAPLIKAPVLQAHRPVLESAVERMTSVSLFFPPRIAPARLFSRYQDCAEK